MTERERDTDGYPAEWGRDLPKLLRAAAADCAPDGTVRLGADVVLCLADWCEAQELPGGAQADGDEAITRTVGLLSAEVRKLRAEVVVLRGMAA